MCSACIPACDGRQCGDDGCGGSCGECGATSLCNALSGVCEASACDILFYMSPEDFLFEVSWGVRDDQDRIVALGDGYTDGEAALSVTTLPDRCLHPRDEGQLCDGWQTLSSR